MWKLLKKNLFLIVFLLPFAFSCMVVTTGCDPYRRGTTVKPVGGAGSKKYHTRTASAKARKKRKY
jgi:hypothetical protein